MSREVRLEAGVPTNIEIPEVERRFLKFANIRVGVERIERICVLDASRNLTPVEGHGLAFKTVSDFEELNYGVKPFVCLVPGDLMRVGSNYTLGIDIEYRDQAHYTDEERYEQANDPAGRQIGRYDHFRKAGVAELTRLHATIRVLGEHTIELTDHSSLSGTFYTDTGHSGK